MKERFNHRIKTYIFVSVVILLIINILSVNRSIKVIEKYIEFNTEYTAVEFKTAYEGVFEFDDYYTSSFSEYSRYHVTQWHNIIDVFYKESVGNKELEAQFYDYLDLVEEKAHIKTEIVNLSSKEQLYPVENDDNETYFNTLNFDELKKTLNNDGNVLFESINDANYMTSKVVKGADGIVISVSYSVNPSTISPMLLDKNRHITEELGELSDEQDNIHSYYIVNSKNEVLYTNKSQLTHRVLNINNAHDGDLLTHKGQFSRLNYSKKFSINEEVLINHSLHLIPLIDGNRVVLVLDATDFMESISEMRFMALLITLLGIVILYVIGTVIIFIVEKNDLTARRVTRSSQANRMLILMFTILLLLNGMAIVQIAKIIFFHGYEAAAIESLDKYISFIETKEDEFKGFVEAARDDAVIESELLYDGVSLFLTESNKDRILEMLSEQSVEYIDSLYGVGTGSRDVLAEIDRNGYYEYYMAPKLFYKDDFDTFYENYILETLLGDNLHIIERVMIYPNKNGDGYVKLSKNLRMQMLLLSRLRDEFKDVCRVNEKEIFVSNITIYNDTGTVVVAQNGQEKFASRKLKDELTNSPLWFWYQFRHKELFRTVVKTVEGNYDERYSLVDYSEPLEYYFVYSIDRRTLFWEMERLYNIYVSAIMFLLVSVFITLGVKIKIKKRG